METCNLPNAEYRTLVIKMFFKLRGRVKNLVQIQQRNGKHKNGVGIHKKEPVRNKKYMN